MALVILDVPDFFLFWNSERPRIVNYLIKFHEFTFHLKIINCPEFVFISESHTAKDLVFTKAW